MAAAPAVQGAAVTTAADLPDAFVAGVLQLLPLADLRSAAAVSRHWARVARESHSFLAAAAAAVDGAVRFLATAVPALAPLDEAAASWRPSEEALCKRLAALTHAAPPPLNGLGVTGLIARALAASTTDNEGESVLNTLNARIHNRVWNEPCYWSSAGSAAPDAEDHVTYGLGAAVCVVHAVQLRPFRAYFQIPECPCYSPLRVRVLLGAQTAPDAYTWHYESPAFPVAQADELQTLTLPRPVLCIGGILRLQLIGRAATQASDGLYYVCVAHVRAQGTACRGWEQGQGGGRLVYDERLAAPGHAGAGPGLTARLRAWLAAGLAPGLQPAGGAAGGWASDSAEGSAEGSGSDADDPGA